MSSILHLLRSSGSLATMAEKMLQEDFKSSHPDLTIWNSNNGLNDSDKEYGEAKNNDNDKPGNKRDPRSVVIQLPESKRRKLDPTLTARRLVHGKLQLFVS